MFSKFQTQQVQGVINVPRMTGTGRDLHNCEDASNFVNTFLKRYRHKGLIDMSITSFRKDMVQIAFTLTSYYPDVHNLEAHWFHEMNLEQTLTNVHRVFPDLSSLCDV